MAMTTQSDRRRRAGIVALAAALALAVPLGAGAAVASTDRHTMLSLTNDARTRRGRGPLKLNRRLSSYAQHHSRWMSKHGLIHTSDMPAKLKGIRWHTWGENIGESPTTLQAMQRAFMASKEHRRNILNRAFHHVAIGCVRVRGVYWVTLIFYG